LKTLRPDIRKAARSDIRRLAEERGPENKVLTLYVNLEASTSPTPQARETQVVSLLDEAAHSIEKLEPGDRRELREDLDGLRSYLLNESEWARGAESVAVFWSRPRDLFEILQLPSPVPPQVAIESVPYLEPLMEVVPAEPWCVVLVNRRNARVFLGNETGLEERMLVHDEVHGQHDQGGWSQARYERSIEREVEGHLEQVAEQLLRLSKDNRFEHLVAGCTEELWPRFLDALHPYLRERVAGRIDVDVEHSSIDDVRTRLEPVVREEEERRERELFERLRRELGIEGRAVCGLEPTLAALNEARVETLLVRPGFRRPGVFCARCGWLGVAGSECPVDRGALEMTDNIVEKARERTVALSGTTHTPRLATDLDDLGDIAALLRF
jgi:peptide chain release factor subunit 1